MLFKSGLIILSCALSLGILSEAMGQQVSAPKIRVGVVPAMDRWVTLTDGSRVYQGVEISYLLGQQLFDSSAYVPVLLTSNAAATPAVVTSSDRLSQIPAAWTQWTTQPEVLSLKSVVQSSPVVAHALSANVKSQSQLASFPVAVDITITPVVESLVYASGQRSDRVVYGFSPDHLNPFNAGEAGALDNQFIASSTQQQSCVMPDFFNGQLNPAGWGPFTGNFGANLDEGVSFQILGFGFSFKQKHFDVQSQIRFLVDDNRSGAHNEYVFQTEGSGNDVFIDGSYAGFNLGFEIQRTQTLLNALQKMLPQIVASLMSHGMGNLWESSIVGVTSAPVLGAGANESVNPGLQLISPFGAIYQVVSVSGTTSTLQQIGGLTKPFIGEPLRVYAGQPVAWPSQGTGTAASLVALAAGNQKIFQSAMAIPTDTTARATSQQAAIQPCFGKSTGWVENTIDTLFTLYAWWRYDNVLDQAAHQNLPVTAPTTTAKIALIDSGVDYNDSALQSHFMGTTSKQVLGYDFISWDNRPSDDNGHGTAAVKLLASLTKKNFIIVPTKVIGAYGETHSSAIYDGFTYAINNHVDAILVPWSSEPSTLTAYQMGAQNAAQAGIPVFVAPNTVAAGNNIYVPQTSSTQSYETSGLEGSSVQLGPDGVATVKLFAQWFESQNLGGTQ